MNILQTFQYHDLSDITIAVLTISPPTSIRELNTRATLPETIPINQQLYANQRDKHVLNGYLLLFATINNSEAQTSNFGSFTNVDGIARFYCREIWSPP